MRIAHRGHRQQGLALEQQQADTGSGGGYFRDPAGASKKVGNGETGAGDNFTLTKDNMDKLKEELQTAIRRTINFDKLKDHMTRPSLRKACASN